MGGSLDNEGAIPHRTYGSDYIIESKRSKGAKDRANDYDNHDDDYGGSRYDSRTPNYSRGVTRYANSQT